MRVFLQTQRLLLRRFTHSDVAKRAKGGGGSRDRLACHVTL